MRLVRIAVPFMTWQMESYMADQRGRQFLARDVVRQAARASGNARAESHGPRVASTSPMGMHVSLTARRTVRVAVLSNRNVARSGRKGTRDITAVLRWLFVGG